MTDVLDALDAALREAGRPAGGTPAAREPARHGPLAASGPRAGAHRDEYALLVEAIREGYELHYGRPRVVAPADADEALLAGDELYALGLDRLARLGDVEAVRELADVISLCAQAHAAQDPELAGAVWEAGAVAVGWGATPELQAAKALARSGAPAARAALLQAARDARADVAPRR